MPPRRCAVLGHPVEHSLSPVMHRAAYVRLGLDWTYDTVDVSPDGLGDFLDGLDPAWRGLSLTMPLKRAVLPYLDEASIGVADVGVCNTVVLEAGRLFGDNTDVPGMVSALAETGVDRAASAVVLGGGATACSAVAALAGLGVTEVHLGVRDPSRAEDVRQCARRNGIDLAVGSLEDGWRGTYDLLVSTVPDSATSVVGDRLLDSVGAVLEVVYEPWEPGLTRRARAAGVTTVDGLDLLAHQAVLQLQLMTGQLVPLALLRDAAHHAVGLRATVDPPPHE